MCRAFVFLILMAGVGRVSAQSDEEYFTLQPAPPIVGRWDVVVQGQEGTYPSWFEVRQSGYRTLVGDYVGQFGSARPIGHVRFREGAMRFQVPPQWEHRTSDIVYEGTLDGDSMRGVTIDDMGQAIQWTAKRAPKLAREGEPSWGKTIKIFNGKNLDGWQARHLEVPHGWKVEDGLLVNAEPGNDLVTTERFMDFKLIAEFRYPAESNSGIYLRGRYEVQIEDNYGDEADSHKIGGVYGFLTPNRNASRKAGEWQSYEITLIGRTITVIFNGERIIDAHAIPGITGGALDSDEATPGPIMLQGDHGPIEFRRLELTPVTWSE